MSIIENGLYENAAKTILAQQWGRIYSWLIECTQDGKKDWYIDDRADPYNFKHLLSWAQPHLASQIYGKRYKKTITGLKYIKKYLKDIDVECTEVEFGS
jgi:hypothetical protein